VKLIGDLKLVPSEQVQFPSSHCHGWLWRNQRNDKTSFSKK